MADRKKILVINPSSSPTITKALDARIKDIAEQFYIAAHIETYTAPSGPPSTDSDDDALMSAKAVMADLQFKFSDYDAYLVACYTLHPLVAMLKAAVPSRIHVIGAFEASVSAALAISALHSNSKFGIITTNNYWEEVMADSVNKYCGSEGTNTRFKGVKATGLTTLELLTTDSEERRLRVERATKKLVQDRDVQAICVGSVALTGLLGDTVSKALREELGEKASSICIVDGVHAGIALLQNMVNVSPEIDSEAKPAVDSHD